MTHTHQLKSQLVNKWRKWLGTASKLDIESNENREDSLNADCEEVRFRIDLTQQFQLRELLGAGHEFPNHLSGHEIRWSYENGIIELVIPMKVLSRPNDDSETWRPAEATFPIAG